MRLPTPSEIRALHARHAPSAEMLDLVHTHCVIVATIADRLLEASGADADRDLVRTGCLLHDIGVYRLYDAAGRRVHDSYLLHGVLGHELLAGAGLPDVLSRFCSRHTGVGLTRDDIRTQHLPLPPDDYVAVTTEERLVMYADKFYSKSTPPRFLTADAYAVHVRRFGEQKAAAFAALRAEFGEPDLSDLAHTHGHTLQTAPPPPRSPRPREH
ncbi:HD domain-containing protein [Streptomyces sp. V4-01]|uniref:HD domain-containing protein n=1 Tax=Actinacidiphila polyblastidii TaxID=3110430 RepID=A0ABU7PGW3_9ACTN|nr:HD domain-containing protein [Streptomyces sp. V4-01]